MPQVLVPVEAKLPDNVQPSLPLAPRDLVIRKYMNPAPRWCLEDIVSWLEQQDPGETYNWDNCRGACCLAQFGLAQAPHLSWAESYRDMVLAIPNVQKIAMQPPWTFGAALERARELVRREHADPY